MQGAFRRLTATPSLLPTSPSCTSDGGCALPLPVADSDIVTMLHPVTHQAMARKLAVDNRSVTADHAASLLEKQTAGEPVSA
ncbi:hypothetical protein [Arthrobacter sp. ISL-28]|uniref:hypothetical protein n=1 Tax=Arthrobacter sp. ISL-28 TaxID=2819108 RepID=UPI001BEB3160|nr:hypothetical protein [Arthrobacter sp. ISL-28]MBT2522359.1 hypothetical protein [Arthrobacter sp. ISL-28]